MNIKRGLRMAKEVGSLFSLRGRINRMDFTLMSALAFVVICGVLSFAFLLARAMSQSTYGIAIFISLMLLGYVKIILVGRRLHDV